MPRWQWMDEKKQKYNNKQVSTWLVTERATVKLVCRARPQSNGITSNGHWLTHPNNDSNNKQSKHIYTSQSVSQ